MALKEGTFTEVIEWAEVDLYRLRICRKRWHLDVPNPQRVLSVEWEIASDYSKSCSQTGGRRLFMGYEGFVRVNLLEAGRANL